MKRLFLLTTVLICLGLLTPAYGGMIVELPLKTDLVDKKGSLGTGAFARSSAATYVHDGILYTADGDDTPFSNASVEDETGATEMRGSFVDGQAWFHDAGGLIAAFVGTGNLFIATDPTLKAYGFIGEVGTGLTEANTYTSDFTVAEDDWTASAGAVAGNIDTIGGEDNWLRFTVDGVNSPHFIRRIGLDIIIGELYRLRFKYFIPAGQSDIDSIRVYSQAAAVLYGAYDTLGTTTSVDIYFTAAEIAGFRIYPKTGGAFQDAGADDVFYIKDWIVDEVTEPAATAVHIYKEHGLTNEGWNAIDTGIDYNAGASWDFDVYVNLMTSTGSTAEARFEDGWLLVEPEGTNFISYSEDFSEWTASEVTLDTAEADPRGETGATGLVGSIVAGAHYAESFPSFADNADVTFSVFAKGGAQDWLRMRLRTKDTVYPSCYFQLSGAGATGTNTSTKESIQRLGTTDWYRCRITHSIGIGAVAPSVRIYSAEGNSDDSFTGDAATIDTYIYGAQVEQTLFMTSYIPTNGIPVTRTTEAGSAADNGVGWELPTHGVLEATLDDAIPPATPTDSQGTLMFDVKWGCDESDIAIGNYGILSTRDSFHSISRVTESLYITYDGTDYSVVNSPAFSAGDIINYVARWGDVDGEANDLSVGLREEGGAWTFDLTPAIYGGAFVLGTDLRLSYGNLYPIHIRNIRFYDVAYTQAQVAAGLERNMLLWMLPFEFP